MTRRIVLILTPLLFFSLFSFAQWEWLNPRPSGYTCSKILFTDPMNGFILSANGDLLVTTDQGTSWSTRQNFPAATAIDIKEVTGVISGNSSAIYITSDKGISWQQKTIGFLDNFSMADVINKDTIFLASSNGKIYRSDDGGNTWQSFNCGRSISCIDFIDSKTGYAGATSQHILKTEDGGATWQPVLTVSVSPSNTFSIKFLDSNTGFAFREHSTLLSTTDAGKTWNSYYIGDDIYSIYFVNGTTGYASGEYGVIYRTDDQGQTWKYIGPSARFYANDLYSIYFINENTGFAVGARGRILKSTDGGTTWNAYSPTYIDVAAVSMPTINTGYAIAANNIYKTTDRGQTWNQLALTAGTDDADRDAFQTCHFLNADTGFVSVSDPARIYKTYNGGLTWKLINITQYGFDNVTCSQFLDKHTGFLAVTISYGGTIVKTKDGGETWTAVWSSEFYGEVYPTICFTDENNGFAARNDELHQTIDGGKTWKMLWKGEDISSIWFVNKDTGFIAGDNGLLKKTIDGGKNWKDAEKTIFYNDSDIDNVKFMNEKVGYFSAEAGAVYKSTDGGETWRQHGKVNYYSVRDITFAPDSTVYIAGQYGAILRSDVCEFNTDNFYLTSQGCEVTLNARITALLATADSLRFEYGVDAYDQVAAATPSSVNNTQQMINATLTDLLPATTYQVRIKSFFRGKPAYSKGYIFRTSNKPALPAITSEGGTVICEGDSTMLSANYAAGNQWYFDGLLISNATQQKILAKKAGKYQLVTTIDCFSSDTASIMISMKPAPVKPVITISGNVLNSSSATGNQWYLNGIAVPNATASTYAPGFSGEYTVRVSADDCQSAFSLPINFIITGINSPELEQQLRIGPNPVIDQLFVKNTGDAQQLSISITDMSGRLVYQSGFRSSITVNMHPFTSGMYIVKITKQKTGAELKKMIFRK